MWLLGGNQLGKEVIFPIRQISGGNGVQFVTLISDRNNVLKRLPYTHSSPAAITTPSRNGPRNSDQQLS